jgi:hypothetical protein
MKVEFLPDLTDGGKYKQVVSEKLLRLYDFDYREALKFRQAVQETIVNKQSQLDLTSLPFIEPINCKLIFAISDDDIGIETEDDLLLICRLTIAAYEKMLYMMEPFCDPNETEAGYNWLYENYDVDSNIDLLFSPGGTW